MSVLGASSTDDLSQRLSAMSVASIKKYAERIIPFLHHREILVRWAASDALGRARVGADALREQLQKESSGIVITEITESLARMRDRASIPLLRRLAEGHSSPTVRMYSLLAIADIEGRSAVVYLYARRAKEVSRRVKAALACALFVRGEDAALADILKGLRSKDFKVRDITVNLLYYYSPKRKRSVIVAALNDALEREVLDGVRGDIDRALREFSS